MRRNETLEVTPTMRLFLQRWFLKYGLNSKCKHKEELKNLYVMQTRNNGIKNSLVFIFTINLVHVRSSVQQQTFSKPYDLVGLSAFE